MPTRVLVVDDNPTNLKLLGYLLQARGFEVHTAENGPDALAAAARLEPAIALVDIQLPGMSGLEVTQRLKADPATQKMLVIIVTASAMQGDEQRALASGCDAYVTKPINTRTLPELIERLLAGERNLQLEPTES